MSDAIEPYRQNQFEQLAQLYQRYIAARDALLQACLPLLWSIVKYRSQKICPSFLDPETFAMDSFVLAQLKFWRGVHDVRNPQQLHAWLKRVGTSAVSDELKPWISRSKKGLKVRWESLDTEEQGDE